MDTENQLIARLTSEELNELAYSIMTNRQASRYEQGEEIDLAYEVPEAGRFRINLCQQRLKPRMVCRYIPENIPSFEELGLPKVVEKLIAESYRGLILVTGATGSGKSTTLAAMIDFITKTRSCHIITIEDPIEFVFKDRKSIVTQREVGLDTFSFSKALKYALRQDPDVILVGEMRDEETIIMALNAAETGHLVLSTLHTMDATETVNRILGSVSAGVQEAIRAQLASTLIGVISQRLVRRKSGTGRIAAVEILLKNIRVRDMILDPARTKDLIRAIEESNLDGMQSFDQSLMDLYKKELISKEEAFNYCSNLREFQMKLEGIVSGVSSNEAEVKESRSDKIKKIIESSNQPEIVEIETSSNFVTKK